MNITLKNLKIHSDMSEETTCFSATIYVDGKRAGTVKNDGRGGSHSYWWFDRDTGQRVTEWAKVQPTQFDFEKLDQVIDDLLCKTEVLGKLKRLAKRQTVFRLKGDEKGAWRTVNAPFTASVEVWLRKKYGDKVECIANADLEAALAFV